MPKKEACNVQRILLVIDRIAVEIGKCGSTLIVISAARYEQALELPNFSVIDLAWGQAARYVELEGGSLPEENISLIEVII